jgi:hypothetical protein
MNGSGCFVSGAAGTVARLEVQLKNATTNMNLVIPAAVLQPGMSVNLIKSFDVR